LRSRKLLSLALAAVILAGIAAAMTLPVGSWLQSLVDWVVEHPVEGAAVYLIFATVCGVLMTPGWIPMMLAGVLFGLGKGIPMAAVGIVGGATAAFLVGRRLLRHPIERRIAGNLTLVAIDRAVDQQAFTIVVLTRLALVLPYNLLNYVYGATRVGLGTYMLATGLGMLPAVALYVYLGTLASDVGQMLNSGGTAPPGSWWISVIALAAIVAVMIVIQRAARRALIDPVSTADQSLTEE
jgi:uncharacterized membrane protein YdjX (TVP38/TMEM64 family)